MALNPLERRLLALREDWERFRADTAKRLLIWRAASDAQRIFQCFLEAQTEDGPCTTGDYFIVYDAPFEDSIQYSKSLKAELAGRYAASTEQFQKQGITPDWNADAGAVPDSASGFIQMLRSFGSKHHEHIGHLVAVFTPAEISSEPAYASWINSCLRAGLPERMRIVLIDTHESPRFDAIARTHQALVHVSEPELDILSIARECFSHDGATGPAAVLRNHLVDLATLLQRGSAGEVRARALEVYAFAAKHQWLDQQVVIQSLVAGAFLKDKEFDAAIKAYQAARQSATRAQAEGHPAGEQLVVQTWFGEAGACLAAQNLASAGQCYEQAARLAVHIPNLILTIEALRMAAHCRKTLGQPALAIARGVEALDQAERLKPDARPLTTLPIAGIELLRTIEPRHVTAMERVSQKLSASIARQREQAERRVTELEGGGNPEHLAVVERRLADEILSAKQVATNELDHIGLQAQEPFRDMYVRLRDLLVESWPETLLETLAALAPAGSGDLEGRG